MSDLPPSKGRSLDELLRLADRKGLELIDGQLVERPGGMEGACVSMKIIHALSQFLRDHRIGHLLGITAGYHCFHGKRDSVRKANVSFIRNGRFVGEKLPQWHS